jgi:hypothetical protein
MPEIIVERVEMLLCDLHACMQGLDVREGPEKARGRCVVGSGTSGTESGRGRRVSMGQKGVRRCGMLWLETCADV